MNIFRITRITDRTKTTLTVWGNYLLKTNKPFESFDILKINKYSDEALLVTMNLESIDTGEIGLRLDLTPNIHPDIKKSIPMDNIKVGVSLMKIDIVSNLKSNNSQLALDISKPVYMKINVRSLAMFYTKLFINEKQASKYSKLYVLQNEKPSDLPILTKVLFEHPFIGKSENNKWVLAYKNYPNYYIGKSFINVFTKYLLLVFKIKTFNEL